MKFLPISLFFIMAASASAGTDDSAQALKEFIADGGKIIRPDHQEVEEKNYQSSVDLFANTNPKEVPTTGTSTRTSVTSEGSN